jgi:hypothetical protein
MDSENPPAPMLSRKRGQPNKGGSEDYEGWALMPPPRDSRVCAHDSQLLSSKGQRPPLSSDHILCVLGCYPAACTSSPSPPASPKESQDQECEAIRLRGGSGHPGAYIKQGEARSREPHLLGKDWNSCARPRAGRGIHLPSWAAAW